jgi:2-polyprenyl-3-methyl-5-hydroxy-6-metoxy-1,4-benzoquinol methylase
VLLSFLAIFVMPLSCEMNTERIRRDFDEIARLTDCRDTRIDRYDAFLVAQVPTRAVDVLDVGCGLGQLTTALASGKREVTGVDLSPEMIARAQQRSPASLRVSFLCCDFLEHDFESKRFDCVVSAATLHHVPEDIAVPRMVTLLRPGGRLVIHDLRTNSGILDHVRAFAALSQVAAGRFLRTGRPRSSREVREAWERHGAGERYFTLQQAEGFANRLLPDARVFHHWLWRYTIVWDKPRTA